MAVLDFCFNLTDIIENGTVSGALADTDAGPYVDEGIRDYNAPVVAFVEFAERSSAWMTFVEYFSSSDMRTGGIYFLDAAGSEIASIRSNTSETFQMYVGGALEGTSSPYAFGAQFPRFDFHLNVNASGEFTFYIAGSPVLSFSGDTANSGAFSGVARIEHRGIAVSSSSGIYNMLATDDDSRLYHVQQLSLTALGADQDWTGDYTAITEDGYGFGAVMTSETSGNKATFVTENTDGAFASGYDVAAVAISGVARNSFGQDRISGMVRSNGAYGYGPIVELMPFDTNFKALLTVDPNTAGAWSIAAVDAMQVGFDHIAPA
jgi:hypothetical protein